MPDGRITPLGIAAATAAAAADDAADDAAGTFEATEPDDCAPLTPGIRR